MSAAPVTAQSRGALLCRALALCASVVVLDLASVTIPTHAQTGGPDAKSAFDIPAQPLSSALDAYSTVAGLELLYDSGVVRHRHSTAVQGDFTAADALRKLLAGTSLSARTIADDAVTIEPLPLAAARPAEFGPAPERSSHQRYFGLIQAGLERAFCKDDQLRPGRYRALLTFTIAANGRIRESRVVGTTGNDGRDRMIASALDGTSLGSPPPADLQQPIMMVILPQSSGLVLNCASIR